MWPCVGRQLNLNPLEEGSEEVQSERLVYLSNASRLLSRLDVPAVVLSGPAPGGSRAPKTRCIIDLTQ